MLYKKLTKIFLQFIVGNEILSTFAPSKMTRSGLFV